MGGTADLPFGLATSVGAVPFTDTPDAVEAAVDMALRLQPAFPTAPTSGGVVHSLLAQAVSGIDGIDVLPPGLLGAGSPVGAFVGTESAGGIDGTAFEPFRAFVADLAAHRDRVGAEFVGVRIGVLGPITLSLALRAAGFDAERSLECAVALVARRAVALVDHVRTEMPGDVVALVMNEPGLIGAMHPTFPLAPSQVLSALTPVVAAVDGRGSGGDLLIGVHVPGRTDWETVICSGVSLISAPADDGVLGWAEPLSQFFADGGRIAWGAVPVDQPLGSGEELLWRRLSSLWCRLVGEGLDPLLLRSRSLTSPVDGLGHFGPSQAALALGLVESLSVRVRRQAIGARLSLGA